MSTINQQIKSFKKHNFEKVLLNVIKDHDNEIIDLNADDQLFTKGVDSDGDSLPEYKSSEYRRLKRMLNPNSVTDLKLTGDFHQGFYVDAGRFPINIDSRDSKTGELVRKYGENIFGLTDENLVEFAQSILSSIQNMQKKDLGLS